jgi:hypothetical protein
MPIGFWVLLGVVLVAQLGLMVFALVDLARRERVTGGHKWLWLLVILFVNLLGPILYIAIGRAQRPPPETDNHPAPAPDKAQRAADVLYGKKDKP